MAKLEILEYPDPRLRTLAQPIEQFDQALEALVSDMVETMYSAHGIGLAATQVDVHKQVLVLDISDNQDQPRVYINPRLVSEEGEQNCEEGCLSVPGVYAQVKRAESIRVAAEDVSGTTFEEDMTGLHAVCLQHEMDHLKGRLFVDYLSPLKQRMVRKKLKKQRRQEIQESSGALI